MINDQIEDFLLIKIVIMRICIILTFMAYFLSFTIYFKIFQNKYIIEFSKNNNILNILNMNADLKIKVVIIGDVGSILL